jgi:hypothetical protein
MKKLTLIAVIILATSAFAQVPNYVPTNGLVGWWPFDGNANDESGNGNNGVVNGAVLTTDRFGVADKSYAFSNDDITVNMQNSIFSNDFSISTWVLLDNFNNTYPTFITQENSYLTMQFSNSTNPPVVNFYFLNNYQIPGQQVEDGTVNGGVIALNNWINVVIVNNNNINQLYINGVYVSSSNSPSILQGIGLGNFLKFGNGDELPLEEFNGKLDDIGIWNRALTDCEIKDLYNSQLGSGNTTSSQTQTALDSYTWPVNSQTYTQSGTYTDTLVNAAGCDSIITLYLTLSFTGINELSTSTLTISPNPTAGDFTIVGLELYNINAMRVSDVNGKLVKELDPTASNFTMGTAKPGVYFLTITAGNKQEVIKLIKE